MDISKRIQNRRIELGMTVDDLAEKIGKNRATVYRYENQEIGKLPVDILAPLAEALQVSPAYLMGWNDDRIISSYSIWDNNPKIRERELNEIQEIYERDNRFVGANIFEFPESVMVPVYGKISAGTPIEAIEDIEEYIDVPKKWIDAGKKIIGLVVDGDSMYPRYMDGDVVVIECGADFHSGDDCAVYVNGYEATIKQVKRTADGVELIPVNTAYAPKRYKEGEYSVLGVILEMRRKVLNK